MFAVLLACGFGLPLPEDVVLISGGILSARGVCNFWVTTFICLAGVLVGDGVVFFAGRRYGAHVKTSWLFRRLFTERVDSKISGIFAKYGDKVVFLGRFMPGLRMPIFLTAGTYKLSPAKFFALDGLAALISVPLWVWVGFIFGDNFEKLEKMIKGFKIGMYGILGAILLIVLVLYFLKRRVTEKLQD
jgi:membrane protein DedA with SNARE-associated domain